MTVYICVTKEHEIQYKLYLTMQPWVCIIQDPS